MILGKWNGTGLLLPFVTAAVLGFTLVPGGARAAGKSASFRVTATHTAMGSQVTVTSRVWITPTQARAEVKHPLEGEAIFLVTDGFFYQLDPQTKKGVKGPLPPEMKARSDNFSFLLARFAFDATDVIKKAKKTRTESLSGYSCDVYESAETRPEGKATMTVWTPQNMDPLIPLKAVVTERVVKPGATLERKLEIQISEVKINAAIPAATFTLPKGYTIQSGAPKPPGAPARRK